MKAGDTFRPAKYDNHLWMIVSDPSMNSDAIVIMNFTTNTKDEEQSCIVRRGEHPFITDNTAIRYRDSRVASSAQLTKLQQAGLLSSREPLSAQLLEKILKGASISADCLPVECREVLESQGLI